MYQQGLTSDQLPLSSRQAAYMLLKNELVSCRKKQKTPDVSNWGFKEIGTVRNYFASN